MLSRMKFKIDPLVKEMLDQFPASTWTSSTSTFLDPAIGGGQFVREIERRLRVNGFSDENIKGRVFGIESSMLNLRYAVNKYKLVGTYSVGDFLTTDFKDMKFDNVVGNPPFQEHKEHGKKVTGNGALWVHFTIKAKNLLHAGGFLAFITPDSWTAPTYDLMGSRESIFNDHFKKYNLQYINFDVKKYFPGVGTDPAAFIFCKDSNYTATKIITSADVFNLDIRTMSFIPNDTSKKSLSIHKKILSTAINSRLFKMRWGKNVTSIKMQEVADGDFKFPYVDSHSYKPMRWANATDPLAGQRKILLPYIGKYQVIIDDDGSLGCGANVSIMLLHNDETTDKVNSYFQSKLITFVMNSNKWTQYILSQILNFIPINTFNIMWTDSDLYKHFNLTQEEIDYIEANVK